MSYYCFFYGMYYLLFTAIPDLYPSSVTIAQLFLYDQIVVLFFPKYLCAHNTRSVKILILRTPVGGDVDKDRMLYNVNITVGVFAKDLDKFKTK